MTHLQTQVRESGPTGIEITSDPNAPGFYRKIGAAKTGWFESRDIPGRRLPILGCPVPPA